MNYLYPIIAIHRDGDTRLFYDAASVLKFVRDVRFVAAEWGDAYTYSFLPAFTCKLNVSATQWILRDDRGRPVDWNDLVKSDNRSWKQRRFDRRGNYEHRNGPVPGCGGWHKCWKFDAPRKRHGGRGVLARAEAHRREFHEDMGRPRVRRHFYVD